MARDRLIELDRLRAFALVGIAVVNMPFLAGPWWAYPMLHSDLDRVAAFASATFFTAKFFVLFAFLFGWGMAGMDESAKKAGVAPEAAWRRRMIALLVFGLLHGVLVFPYDILMLYGALGLMCAGLRRKTVRQLIVRARFSLFWAAGFFIALGGAETIPGEIEPNFGPGYLGDFPTVVAHRLTELMPGLIVNLLYNLPLSYGAFCLGLAAAKSDFFNPDNTAFARWRARLPLLLAAGLALNAPIGLATAFSDVAPDWVWPLSYGLLALGGPTLAAVYMLTIVGLSRRFGGTAFSAAGRMSMTAYVGEGIVGGFIFFGYGLGLFGAFGAAAILATALGVYLVVEIACSLWLKVFRQGPLETLARGFAYRR